MGAGARLDATNPFFDKLLVWTDSNHDGICQSAELKPFGEQFAAVLLGYEPWNRRDGNGNTYRYHGVVHERTAPGRNPTIQPKDEAKRSRSIYDVWLQVERQGCWWAARTLPT